MSDLQIRGPLWGGSASPAPFTAGPSGAQRVADAHARYMQSVLEGRVFLLSAAAANASAYVGAAAGTPLIAIFNPPNSGKNIFVLQESLAQQTTGTAAAAEDFAWWGGTPGTIGTGTKTNPTNLLSLQAVGSIAQGYVNTALTSQTNALALIKPVLSVGAIPVTTATLQTWSPATIEEAGLIVCVPGNLIALGAAAATTAAKFDISVIWEEVPILP
jgi:hypothetical protein